MADLRILRRPDIEAALRRVDLIMAMERAFAASSDREEGGADEAELRINAAAGLAEIACGSVPGSGQFLVEVETWFGVDGDPERMRSAASLLFSTSSGALQAIVADEGTLAAGRRAASGALAAKFLAPDPIEAIGLLGTGPEARLQLFYLRSVTDCLNITAWDCSAERAEEFAFEARGMGYEVKLAEQPSEVAANCNLIIITTAGERPLLKGADLRPGTHINCIASPPLDACKLDARLLRRADLIAADSRKEALSRGESRHAHRSGLLEAAQVTELGELVRTRSRARSNAAQITIADVTGTAAMGVEALNAIMSELDSGVSKKSVGLL